MLIDNTAQLTLFTLILMRMSGFILLNPVLGRRNVPAIVKAGMIFVLTLAIYSFSENAAFDVESTVEYGFLLIKEFAAGYVIGFAMELFFMVLSFGGYIIDFQMGLSMAMVYDPQSNAQIPVSGSMFQAWFMLLFFAVDAHLVLMKILLTSAEIVPYGGIIITQNLPQRMVEIFLQCIEMGVRIAMPILAAEFLIEIGVGILNKAVPQISIVVINIQFKLIVGLVLLVVLFSPMGEYMSKIISEMMKTLEGILTFLG